MVQTPQGTAMSDNRNQTDEPMWFSILQIVSAVAMFALCAGGGIAFKAAPMALALWLAR